jgi:RNA recognition motif-containing protein
VPLKNIFRACSDCFTLFAFCFVYLYPNISVFIVIKLFVGGFPLDITELELVMLIGTHGDVDTIKIVRDKKTRKCKGYAFVEMKDQEGADRAVEALDGTLIGDRLLSVKITEDKPAPVKRPFSKFSNGPSSRPAYLKVERTGGEIRKKRPRK